MTITYQDPTDRAEGMLLSQYNQSENLKKYLNALILPIESIMRANKATVDTREINQAYGHSLDKIGRVVGISRTISGATTLGLFGFYANAVAEGFGIGTFYSYGDRQTGDLVLNDLQYRNFIRARVLVNTGGGKIEDVIRYIELLLGRTLDLEITETEAAFHVRVHATLPIADKALLAVAVKNIKTAGVTMTMSDDAGAIVLP